MDDGQTSMILRVAQGVVDREIVVTLAEKQLEDLEVVEGDASGEIDVVRRIRRTEIRREATAHAEARKVQRGFEVEKRIGDLDGAERTRIDDEAGVVVNVEAIDLCRLVGKETRIQLADGERAARVGYTDLGDAGRLEHRRVPQRQFPGIRIDLRDALDAPEASFAGTVRYLERESDQVRKSHLTGRIDPVDGRGQRRRRHPHQVNRRRLAVAEEGQHLAVRGRLVGLTRQHDRRRQ